MAFQRKKESLFYKVVTLARLIMLQWMPLYSVLWLAKNGVNQLLLKKKNIHFYCSKIMIWYVFKFNNHMHFSFKLPMYSIKKQIFKSCFLSFTVMHYSLRYHFLLMYLVASSVRTFHLLSFWNCFYLNACMISSLFFSVLLKSQLHAFLFSVMFT